MTLDLEALTAVAKAATPGPWTYADNAPMSYGSAWVNAPEVKNLATCDGVRKSEHHGFCLVMNPEENERNARLIVAAVNALPALIEEVKRLRGVVEGVVDAVAYTEGEGGRRSYGLRPSFGPAFQAARAALPSNEGERG